MPSQRHLLASLVLACGLVLVVALALSAPAAKSASSGSGASLRYAVTIQQPDDPPRLDTGLVGPDGEPITVSCQTCHATKAPNTTLRNGEALADFHQGLHFDHGRQACASCHNANNYDELHLANGDSLPFAEVKTLCGQCHGPQARDYDHGAHGGMSGHWDLTRGPRLRNTCTQCHDPHAPKFQPMIPAAPPADRFAPRLHTAHEAPHD